jgi:hypothetical protein
LEDRVYEAAEKPTPEGIALVEFMKLNKRNTRDDGPINNTTHHLVGLSTDDLEGVWIHW